MKNRTKQNATAEVLAVVFGLSARALFWLLVGAGLVVAVALLPVALAAVGACLLAWAGWRWLEPELESLAKWLREAGRPAVALELPGEAGVLAAVESGVIDAPVGSECRSRQIVAAALGWEVPASANTPEPSISRAGDAPEESDDEVRAREANPLAGLPVWDDDPEVVEQYATVGAVNLLQQTAQDVGAATPPVGAMPAAARESAPADPVAAAMELVAGGMAVKRAARECGVPESTLRGRLRRRKAG